MWKKSAENLEIVIYYNTNPCFPDMYKATHVNHVVQIARFRRSWK